MVVKQTDDYPTKLLWIDLEMTGLDPQTQRIIEVAAIVADFDFNQLGRYDSVVNQPDSVLDQAEDWPKQNMQALFAEVRQAKKDEPTVVSELCSFITQHFGQDLAVLAGNSIHQDRRFIRKWWPDVEKLLHYRMFDVSTFKIWTQSKLGKEYAKNETHRANDDILESIEELKWLLEQLRN